MFQVIDVPDTAPLSAPLSHAIRAGDFVFVSGQASTDPRTGAFVPASFEEEFARTIENLRRILSAAGADLGDVVRVGAYLRDESVRPLYNELYARTFRPPYPARTTIGNPFQFLQVELDCVAYLGPRDPGSRSRRVR